jgi:hypothetical protein
MKIGIYSESTDATTLSLPVLAHISVALAVQIERDLAGWWEVQPVPIRLFASEKGMPSDYLRCVIKDEIPEAPDALAYHTTDDRGRPKLVIGWKAIKYGGGLVSTGPESLSATLSHEILETIIDPYVNFWADLDADHEVALEVCDPVEGDSYEIDDVAVSNFVGPRWFSDGDGPYDFMGRLTKPRTMSPGGYMVLRKGGPAGTTKQVYGAVMPNWKRTLKAKYGRRVRTPA